MEGYPFYIVDVFTENKYAGNQLAVFTEIGELSSDQMQKIAKEMNFSETTFILSREERNKGYDVRIFTPENELPFAGHPTLGTAYIIQREFIRKQAEKVTLNLKAGQIPVTFNYSRGEADILWMKQLNPVFGSNFDIEIISSVLSLSRDEIDENFPVQSVSTGVPSIIVPLKNLDSVKRAKIAQDEYFKLVEDIEAKGILVFSPETYSDENKLNVRFFADYYGVPEDPATGSANGCLAAYLVRHLYFKSGQINIRVEQGYEIGRPSLLFLKAEKKDGEIDVFVGGKVVLTARGEFV